MNDKLKEIRDRFCKVHFKDDWNEYYDKPDVVKIQSETYQLGRQEVIREIDEWLSLNSVLTDNKDFYKAFKSKLNNLKK